VFRMRIDVHDRIVITVCNCTCKRASVPHLAIAFMVALVAMGWHDAKKIIAGSVERPGVITPGPSTLQNVLQC
jgi:hypothetical protein